MATKAAERAREWLQTQPLDEIDLAESEALDVPGLLAAYEAATIERCAQIADDYSDFISTLPESKQPIASFANDLTKRVAAAIRSMGDANGDDK